MEKTRAGYQTVAFDTSAWTSTEFTKRVLGLRFVAAWPGAAGHWLTFGHDPQRTGWAFEETAIKIEVEKRVLEPLGVDAAGGGRTLKYVVLPATVAIRERSSARMELRRRR